MKEKETPVKAGEKITDILEMLRKRDKKILLLSDLDGTLLELAAAPDQVIISQELLHLLKNLIMSEKIHGPVIVSGRSLENLTELLPLAGLELAGQHGCHLQEKNGQKRWLLAAEDLRPILKGYKMRLAQLTAGMAGVLIEDKEWGIALHYRGAAPGQTAKLLEQAGCLAGEFTASYPLELLEGNKVLEIRPLGMNKSQAVAYYCRRYPKALPVYLGDDRTDEDAFRSLPGEGVGILVAAAKRESAACCRLKSVGEVLKFLDGLCGL